MCSELYFKILSEASSSGEKSKEIKEDLPKLESLFLHILTEHVLNNYKSPLLKENGSQVVLQFLLRFIPVPSDIISGYLTT